MALTGYKKVCRKISSGIVKIALIEVADFKSATLDTTDVDSYATIETETGKKFKTYKFQEDEAEYKETATVENNVTSFEKSLQFKMEEMSAESRKAVMEIVDASACGLIALIKRPGQKVMLIGYTEEEGKEKPLKISAAEATTGKKVSDAQGEDITISCTSAEKSRYFLGDADAQIEDPE